MRRLAGAVRNRAWPDGKMPYIFEDHVSDKHRALIKKAISELVAQVGGWCLDIVEVDPKKTDDAYVIFRTNQRECVSYIGHDHTAKKHEAYITLSASSCMKISIIKHEIMHALGFVHTQQRPDRDEYVTVHLDKVRQKGKKEFKKYTYEQIDTLGVKYDHHSIMHYGYDEGAQNAGENALTSRTKKTLRSWTEDPTALSQLDVNIVRKFYTCDAKRTNRNQRSGSGVCGGEATTDPLQTDYRGCQTKTINGRTCQAWDVRTYPDPHRFTYIKGNYCRNPDASPQIWCFTGPSGQWEFCKPIPEKVCTAGETTTGNQTDYEGCQNKTVSGRPCEDWGSYRDTYPNLKGNYCRNPVGDNGGIWCFTMDKIKDWEYCDPIPEVCTGSEVTTDPLQTDYEGCQTKTINGRTCQAWDVQTYPKPHRFTYIKGNYCRNPDASPQIWCFTGPSGQWGFCKPIPAPTTTTTTTAIPTTTAITTTTITTTTTGLANQ